MYGFARPEEMIAIGLEQVTLSHFVDVLDYLLLLKNQTFNFCAVPASMALVFYQPAAFLGNHDPKNRHRYRTHYPIPVKLSANILFFSS
jgi:hypothetical protein